MRVTLISDIGQVMPKIDWEGKCTLSRRKLKRAGALLELKIMTSYERVKSTTAGPVTDTYFELKMLCLFYFVLKSENKGQILRLQWYMRNNSIFPFYFLFQFLMSIDSCVNSSRSSLM